VSNRDGWIVLAKSLKPWDISSMVTAKADNRRRVQIPDIKAGQVFSIETPRPGVIVLHEVRPVEPKPIKGRLIKENGFTILDSDQPVDERALKAALAEFP
jgi:hypothetical protein